MTPPTPGPEAAASRPVTLRRSAAWMLVGNCGYAACQWAMLVVLAKLGSARAVGQFSLALALVSPVFMFTGLQLRAVLMTDVRGQHPVGRYLGLRLWTSALALVGLAVVALWGQREPGTAEVIVLVALWKAVESVSDVALGAVQRSERMDRVAVSLLLKGGLALAVMGGLLLATGSLVLAVAGMVVVVVGLLVGYDVPAARDVVSSLRPEIALRPLMPLLQMSLPLGAVMGLISLNSSIPRFFLERHLGVEALGYFAAPAYLVVAGSLVVNAFGQAASPRLARAHARGDGSFLKVLGAMAVVSAVLGAGGVLAVLVAGGWVLAHLYTPEYAAHAGMFQVIMLGAAISYLGSVVGYGLTAMRVFKVQTALSASATLACAGASALLVPRMGLVGAAWAGVASAAVQLAGAAGVMAVVLRRARAGESGEVAVQAGAEGVR